MLRRLPACAPSDESPTTKLRNLFSDILVDHVWMVTTKADPDHNDRSNVKRFYMAKEPEEKNSDFLQFSSIVSFQGKELSRTIQKSEVAYRGLAPQSKIAARFKPLLADESKLIQWETLMIGLIDSIVGEPEIDPILQVALLRKVVEGADEGSEPLRESLEVFKKQLDEAVLDTSIPWMNPETPRLGQARVQAADIIRGATERCQAG